MSLNTTVATSNLQAHMALGLVAASVHHVKHEEDPDIWGFQEIGGVVKATRMRIALGHKNRLIRRHGSSAECPIAFNRKRYRLEKVLTWHLSDSENVGKEGAGPTTLRAKDALVLVLWDKHLHRHVVVANAHLAPSPTLNEARAELHAQQVDRLVALYQWVKQNYPHAVVFFLGDWNAWQRFRLRPLENAGLHLGLDVPTHGKHPYDRIASNEPGQGERAITTHSDHKTLVRHF